MIVAGIMLPGSGTTLSRNGPLRGTILSSAPDIFPASPALHADASAKRERCSFRRSSPSSFSHALVMDADRVNNPWHIAQASARRNKSATGPTLPIFCDEL